MKNKRLNILAFISALIMLTMLSLNLKHSFRVGAVIQEKILPSFIKTETKIEDFLRSNQEIQATLMETISHQSLNSLEFANTLKSYSDVNKEVIEVGIISKKGSIPYSYAKGKLVSTRANLLTDELKHYLDAATPSVNYDPDLNKVLMTTFYPISVQTDREITFFLFIKEDLSPLLQIIRGTQGDIRSTTYIIDESKRYVITPQMAQIGNPMITYGNIPLRDFNINEKIIFQKWLNTKTEKESFLFISPLSNQSWTLYCQVYKNDFVPYTKTDQLFLILVLISISLFIFCIFIAFINFDLKNNEHLFKCVKLISTVAICNIIAIIIFSNGIDQDRQFVIYDKESVLNLIDSSNSPTPIYTTILVEDIDFVDPTKIAVSGFVILRIPKTFQNDIPFTFGNLAGGFSNEIKELSSETTADGDKIKIYGLDLVLLSPPLNFFYPFDQRNIYFNFIPLNKNQPIYFQPDFYAYSNLISSEIMGINNDIVIEGWNILESFFNYSYQNVFPTFNYADGLNLIEQPTLNFNISIKRRLSNAILSNLLPVFIAIPLIFFILLLPLPFILKHAFNILTYLAAIIFIIVLNHSSLRGNAGISGYSLVENIYLNTYALIVYFIYSVISMIVNKTQSRWVFYQDRLTIYYLFWPIICLVLYRITFTASIWGAGV